MRAVLDTNTIISGLFWSGSPRRVLRAAESQDLTITTSPPLLGELLRVLNYPKLAEKVAATGRTPEELLALFAHMCTIVQPEAIEPTIKADPDDDMVLACALGAKSNVIVSGDTHLLTLGSFRNIPIITARELLERLNR